MASGFIEDGMTRTGYIEDSPGLHSALTFEYRPMLVAEVNRAGRKIERDQDHAEDVAAAEIEKRLVGWDLRNGKGEILPTTSAVLLRLEPVLFGKLWRVIQGLRSTDTPPSADELGEQAAREKNSAAG